MCISASFEGHGFTVREYAADEAGLDMEAPLITAYGRRLLR